jgi:hypothetical protein
MKLSLLRKCATAALALPLLPVLAEQVAPPAPLGKPAASAYRQLTPDGRVLYSDKPVKGAKVQQEITPPPKGVVAMDESKDRRPAPPQAERKPVARVAGVAGAARPVTLDEANSAVIGAEMLLEDARKRQQAGTAPLPDERIAGNGGEPRVNAAYVQRQQVLAQEVAQAKATLHRARVERDALQHRQR